MTRLHFSVPAIIRCLLISRRSSSMSSFLFSIFIACQTLSCFICALMCSCSIRSQSSSRLAGSVLPVFRNLFCQLLLIVIQLCIRRITFFVAFVHPHRFCLSAHYKTLSISHFSPSLNCNPILTCFASPHNELIFAQLVYVSCLLIAYQSFFPL